MAQVHLKKKKHNEGQQLGSLETDTSSHSKAVRKKHLNGVTNRVAAFERRLESYLTRCIGEVVLSSSK